MIFTKQKFKININRLILIFILIVGFLISSYLTYNHYFSSTPFLCSGKNNCDKVLASKYSQIFNIPLSFLGSIYFLILLGLILFLDKFISLMKIIKFLILVGFGVSLILIYLQIFVIKAICFYCIVVDSILLISPIIFFFNKKKFNNAEI